MGAFRNKLKEERGVIFILFIVVLLVLLAFAALALDVGNVMVVKNELQNISDGAALAGARYLGKTYEGMSYLEQNDPDKIAPYGPNIKSAAQEVGTSNSAEGIANVNILASDVELGHWDRTKTPPFQPTPPPWDAVRATVRKDGNANSSVVTYFARLFGMNTVDVSAKAVAALTGQSMAFEGGIPIPIGISYRFFQEGYYCGKRIRLYPTCPKEPCNLEEVGCGGWTTFFSGANTANLRKILEGLLAGTYKSPEVHAQINSVEFYGGSVAAEFPDLLALYNLMKDSDGKWTTSVIVYDSDTCENPNKPLKIETFATVIIDKVLTAPDKIIEGTVICGFVDEARGGGIDVGTKGSIPGLVQ